MFCVHCAEMYAKEIIEQVLLYTKGKSLPAQRASVCVPVKCLSPENPYSQQNKEAFRAWTCVLCAKMDFLHVESELHLHSSSTNGPLLEVILVPGCSARKSCFKETTLCTVIPSKCVQDIKEVNVHMISIIQQQTQSSKNVFCKIHTDEELNIHVHICPCDGAIPFKNNIYWCLKTRQVDNTGSTEHFDQTTVLTGMYTLINASTVCCHHNGIHKAQMKANFLDRISSSTICCVYFLKPQDSISVLSE